MWHFSIGTQGEWIELWKSSDDSIQIGCNGASFLFSPIYVGDMPRLSALGGLVASSPPAAILGMDMLRICPKMLYRQNEVFF